MFFLFLFKKDISIAFFFQLMKIIHVTYLEVGNGKKLKANKKNVKEEEIQDCLTSLLEVDKLRERYSKIQIADVG